MKAKSPHKKKSTTPRKKRKTAVKYVDKEGNYLAVGGNNYEPTEDSYYITWMVESDEGGFEEGSSVGEELYDGPEPPIEDVEKWEVWATNTVAEKHADSRKSSGQFAFHTYSKAKQALQEMNALLLGRKLKWPEWAVKAKAAGWEPPSNWQPK